MRAALYTRVSTHDQQTLAMQRDALQEFAIRRGWTVTETVEEIASGAKDNRPKRQALLTAARRRQLDVILVWKLDRWGRSLVDLMTTLRELTALGVGFVSLTEALDLTTPAGRAFAGFLAVFAEFERDVMRERIKAGITDARNAGRPMADHVRKPTMRHRSGPGAARPEPDSDCAPVGRVAHVRAAGVGAAGGPVSLLHGGPCEGCHNIMGQILWPNTGDAGTSVTIFAQLL